MSYEVIICRQGTAAEEFGRRNMHSCARNQLRNFIDLTILRRRAA